MEAGVIKSIVSISNSLVHTLALRSPLLSTLLSAMLDIEKEDNIQSVNCKIERIDVEFVSRWFRKCCFPASPAACLPAELPHLYSSGRREVSGSAR